MRSLSQQMLDRKRARVEAEVWKLANDWAAAGRPFGCIQNVPTNEQMVAMFMAARFGPGDPLSAGGELFACEYVLDELTRSLDGVMDRWLRGGVTLIDRDGDTVRIVSSQSEVWANLLFVMDVDETLAKHWTSLKVGDFDYIHTDGENLDYAVEKESQAFGFRLEYSPLVTIREATERYCESLKFAPQFQPNSVKANDKCTIYFLSVAPLDRLMTPEERRRHGVQAFSRRTASGKLVPVRPHERRNPRKLATRAENLDEVGHVVYRVFDCRGQLRYYGEGTIERPGHVNSGISHNFKLNEHFFLNGPMRIEVFARGLSKDEALSVERLCIRGHTGSGLWNVKDYERRPDPDD